MKKSLILGLLPAALVMTGCMSLAPTLESSKNIVPTEFTTTGIYANNEVGEIKQEDLLWSSYVKHDNLK